MTDVTGFGLMGHARELAFGSGVRLELIVDQVPRMQGALDCIERGRHSRWAAGESRVCRMCQRRRARRSYRGRCACPAV